MKVELQNEEKKLQAVNIDNSAPATSSNAGTTSNKATPATAADMAAGSNNINEAIFKEEMRCEKNRRMMLHAEQFLDQVKVGRCMCVVDR